MAFRIELAGLAEQDLFEAIEYIAQDSPSRAHKWYHDLLFQLDGLRQTPQQYPLIKEAQKLGRALRSIHFHSHRVIYEVQDSKETVFVVRIYHTSRRQLTKKDI